MGLIITFLSEWLFIFGLTYFNLREFKDSFIFSTIETTISIVTFLLLTLVGQYFL